MAAAATTATATETATETPPPPPSSSSSTEHDGAHGAPPADDADVEESPAREGRSENSLAYLCQRFCDLYRDQADAINIDHAAKELGIQRRRMYEILNIIQSVGLVARLRSSFYRWEGDDKMALALERLKDEGLGRLVPADASTASAAKPVAGAPPATPEGQRKKAVATALGERFVQVFLCNEVPQPIVLEDIMGLFSSCVAGSSGQTNQMSCARRLYDIANVFCAIGLVAKTSGPTTDQRRKKRYYEWTGPVLPASTTPVRPAIARGVTAASPAAGSAKRAKRASHETPPVRKRAKLRLTDSPRRIKAEPPQSTADELSKPEGKRRGGVFMVLPHPSVASLPGTRRLSLNLNASGPPSLTSKSSATADGGNDADESTFQPTNAKDGALDLPLAPLLAAASRPEQQPESATKLEAPFNASSSSSCQCPDHSQASMVKTEGEEASSLLKAQVEHLTKALEEARSREKDLLKRIEMQDAQINKLLDLKHGSERRHARDRASSTASTPSGFALRGPLSGFSPLTTLALSPCQSLGRDPFGLASPSPFSGSFSTGLTGSGSTSRRPPTARKARIGPQIVDPTIDEDTSKHAPHLSPHTTSVASSLLLSPMDAGSAMLANLDKDKENRLDRFLSLTSSPASRSTARSAASMLSSPALARVALSSSTAPGTPPSHLIATAASSLLSLTPTQGRQYVG
ncbi:hypothetical protein P43SY_003604 [Pythium insidiosum]|uniref:E2F/DP family winged-helix DNA-binding domain-containing protein n=1 Tax=Pythium insidiosum TaxID=114742 RepID=A0AAD5M8D7_PYTIN|nr:hypothetical protein P43SY_003604 [Pythium insidiosum]